MGLQPFNNKAPHRLLEASSRAALGQITISGIPNRQNYCVVFIVHTLFRNLAAGRGFETHALFGNNVCVSVRL